MGFLKYCYFIIFFIANGILGESSRESKLFDPAVKTKFYITGSNCENIFCQIDYSSCNCCHNLKNNSRLTVLIHGFSRGYKEEWINKMTEQLIKMPNMNVIAINWRVQHSVGPLPLRENTMWYHSAFKNIPFVADQSAQFLAHIIKSKIGYVDHLHILGHSMGGHVAGQVADRLKNNDKITVNRITGLDPALPCFRDYRSDLSLRPSHADFVDVIHTNSLYDDDSTFGLYRRHGHVDIYPNGGNDQPNCPRWRKPLLPALPGQPILSFGTTIATCEAMPNLARNLGPMNHDYLWCNHFKAPEYMTLSMKHQECQFLAVPLENKGKSVNEICKGGGCVGMGIKAENYKALRGQYYINMDDLLISNKKCFA